MEEAQTIQRGQTAPVRAELADTLIRTEGLTKRYGSRVVVDDVHLDVRRGDVFGLLGPNGSGKTTTIRMLLGLVLPTSGRIECFGHDLSDQEWMRLALQRVGAVVEQPSFYPFLTGRENLLGMATFSGLPTGAPTRARIESVLRQVGLGERGGETYRKYSLGMKQRLGIAAALLTDPEVVVLDEPTNGLDPAGMVEVRALITHLARRGTTVFLSSHLLHEVQQVCTRVAVLKDGRLLAQGAVGDLLASGRGVQVSFANQDDFPRAVAVLQSAQETGTGWLNGARYVPPEPGQPVPPGGWYLLINAPPERAGAINQLLASQGLYAHELRWRDASLEQFFLALTGAQGASEVPVPVGTAANAQTSGGPTQ